MSWIDADLPQKQCCECFYWYPADNHHYAKQYQGRYGVASRCKLCTTEVHALLRKLKAAHPKPPPGSLCERCNWPPTTEGTRGRGLRGIATALDNLNLTNATSKLEWWYELLHEAARRIHRLQLDIDDPPTYDALDSGAFNR